MGIIILLGTIAVAVLLLSRLPDLRAVLAAAVISSAAAGFWLAVLPWLPRAFGARMLLAPQTGRTLVEFALGAIVVTFAQTIVPNLIALGVVRRWLRTLRPPRRRGIWPTASLEAPVWTTLTAGLLVVPVGIVYGQLALLATLAMWSFVLILSDQAIVAGHMLKSLLWVPAVQGMAAVGGITAIGVQAALDRKGLVARSVGAQQV